jgi:hypothetical protein
MMLSAAAKVKRKATTVTIINRSGYPTAPGHLCCRIDL